jgi:hypothetical protein
MPLIRRIADQAVEEGLGERVGTDMGLENAGSSGRRQEEVQTRGRLAERRAELRQGNQEQQS